MIRMTVEELDARLRAASPRTPDDVSITSDGRRLDSKEAVLAWWADVASDIEAEQVQRDHANGVCRD
jgi:hypothetical protein